MTDNELLLSLSSMLDQKLKAELEPLKRTLTRIEVDLLENNVIPRLNTIESCYTPTYNRYKDCTDEMQTAFQDINIIKKVLTDHSKQLQHIS